MGRSTFTSASRNEYFVAALTAVLVFLMAARTPLDSDLFWHLRAGSDTLDQLRPVVTDLYSYTRAGQPWVSQSWLTEVVLAITYRVAGWTGLSALVAGLATLSMHAVYRRMSGPPLWRAFIVLLAVLVVAPVWSPRPAIFSLCLLLVLDDLLRREMGWKQRAAWTAALFILWSNLHGGYALGVILLGCKAAGALVDRWSRPEKAGGWRPFLEPIGLAGLGFFVAGLNPNGAAMWLIPFQTVGVDILRSAIPEWASPDFHDLTQQPFLWMLAGLIAALGMAGKPVNGFDLVKVVVFAAMGLMARRNFGPFSLLAAPVLSMTAWDVLSRLVVKIKINPQANRPLSAWAQYFANATLYTLIALAAIAKLVYVSHPVVVEGFLQQQYPAGAVEYLRAEQPSGRLFSTYAWGGYLVWALPDYPVFVDGRTDLFGDEIIGQWLTIISADPGGGDKPGWEALIERWQIELVLIEPRHALDRELRGAGWVERYADETAVVLEKPK
jgi:hypothetical protein